MAALETKLNKIIYPGDGSSVAFSFPYLFYKDVDLKVYLNDTTSEDNPVLQTIVTHYSITGAGADAGGTVTAVTAPTATEEWIIERVVEETQESEYTNYNRFPAGTIEKGYNRLTMMVQQLTERLSRALLKPVNETTVTTIPSPTTDRALKWDSSGNLINSTYDPDDQQQSIADAQAAQVAAELAETNAKASETAAALSETNAATSAASFVNIQKTNDVRWEWTSNTQITVKSGSKFVGINGNRFELASDQIFDITTSGIGGLLGASEATSTIYYLIGMGDTSAALVPEVAAMTKAEYDTDFGGGSPFDADDLPSTYDDYWRIGICFNDSSGNLEDFRFADGIVFIETGGSYSKSTATNTWEDVDWSALLPASVVKTANVEFLNTTSSNTQWRIKGSGGGFGVITGGVIERVIEVQLNDSGIYEVNASAGTMVMKLHSFKDNLERNK